MTTQTFYKPLENANTFINKIVDKYDNAFKVIRIYGSEKKPLFLARDIYVLLFEKDGANKNINSQLLKHLSDYDTDINNEFCELIRGCPLQITKLNQNTSEFTTVRKINTLTKYGVYRMMFSSNKSVAVLFRKFIYIILDELENNGKVELKEAMNQLQEQLEYSHNKFEEMQKYNYELLNDNRKMYDECRDSVILKRHMQLIKNNDVDAALACKIGLEAYQQTYGKSMPIYLINDAFIEENILKEFGKKSKRGRKPKQIKTSDFDSDSNEDNEEINILQDITEENLCDIDIEYIRTTYELPIYESSEINFERISKPQIKQYIADLNFGSNTEIDNDLYFTFGKLNSKSISKEQTKFKYWESLYFFNDAHYTNFLKQLNEYQLNVIIPNIKNKLLCKIYKIPYAILLSKHQETLGNITWKQLEKINKSA